MKLLIGTTNLAKQKEHKRIITTLAKKNKLTNELVFPQDLRITSEPEETGKTIEENSMIKAKYYFRKSGILTIADDGGLEIDALGGAPGVQAKYWADESGDDQKIITKTIKELEKFPSKGERRARLRICVTYIDGKVTFQEFGSIEGYIAKKPTNNFPKGFPYRALFIVNDVVKYYDELSAEEHARFNHREKALKKLFGKIALYDRNFRKTSDR